MNLFLIPFRFPGRIFNVFCPLHFADGSRVLGIYQRIVQKHSLGNALLYVSGFMLVFILLGGVFSIGGAALRQYHLILQRIGGLVHHFFGLMTTGLFTPSHFPDNF